MKSANKLWSVLFALIISASAYCDAGEKAAVQKFFSEEKKEEKQRKENVLPVANPMPVKAKFEDRARQEYEQHIKETRSKRRMWDTMMCPSRVYDRG